MDEADSLLQLLIPMASKTSVQSKEEKIEKTENKDMSQTVVVRKVEGLKHPKDDTIVIEEMCTVNQQLRSLVSQLLSQLEDYARENKDLRDKVQSLELALANQRVESDMERRGGLRVITDSGSSPFVFSPCSELSPDSNFGMNRELPPLAPLEMPNFDFSMFKMKSGDAEDK